MSCENDGDLSERKKRLTLVDVREIIAEADYRFKDCLPTK